MGHVVPAWGLWCREAPEAKGTSQAGPWGLAWEGHGGLAAELPAFGRQNSVTLPRVVFQGMPWHALSLEE